MKKILNVRNALRSGDWEEAETVVRGWEEANIDAIAATEFKRVSMECEDRHVIESLELYVLSSGSLTNGSSVTSSSSSSSTPGNSGGGSGRNSVQGVLSDGLKRALAEIETKRWTPRSNQARGLHEAASALASIYSAVDARNWTESLSVLKSISSKSGKDHWSSMLWEETWESIRSELKAMRALVERESTTERLRNVLMQVARMCSQATESMEQQDYGKMEESLLSLDKELNPKKK